MNDPAIPLFPDAPTGAPTGASSGTSPGASPGTSPGASADPHAGALSSTGIVPSQGLRQLIRKKAIWAEREIPEENVQPASLDLRLGPVAWRVRASFLPGPGATVRDKIDALAMHEIDLREGAVLEKGCAYIVRLQEHLNLTRDIAGICNPKSSIGRLDVFTRVITDRASEFDAVAAGYKGPLYAEIAPLAFSVIVREGSRLGQLRLKRGSPTLTNAALKALWEEMQANSRGATLGGEGGAAAEQEPDAAGPESGPAAFVDEAAAASAGHGETYRGGFPISVDLSGSGLGSGAGGDSSQPIGWKAKSHAPLIDVDLKGAYDVADFWEPVFAPPKGGRSGTGGGSGGRPGGLILDPNDFYILASKEAISVPPDYAAEMVAYDTMVGEFRVHYAGFFDPGFGHGEAGGQGMGTAGTGGTRAVLEVRSHEVPFLVEDGQTVGRLMYEKLAALPDKLYGQDIGSSYQRQGLKLGKQFKPVG